MKVMTLVLSLVAVIAAAASALAADGYHAYVLGLIGLTVIVTAGLSILMGLAGQISIGQIAFYALGAYAGAILTAAGVPFLISLLAAAALTGVVGALLVAPAMRVRGPYLAMVTIAFAFVVEHGLVEWRGLTGGANGLLVPPVQAFGVVLGAQEMALVIVLATALALAGFALLRPSGWGLAMRAVKGSETAAAAIGVNVLAVKTAAFAIAAAYAGFAGALFAPLSGFINPESFPLLSSIIFVLAVMAGGAGSVAGALIGGVVVVVLPEALASLEQYRLLFMGLLLLIVLWIAPRGVVGAVSGWRRRRPEPRASPPTFDLRRFRGGNLPPKALAVTDLAISFGGVRAVAGLSFRAAGGAVTSLIGPNGAGKTTALNLICGFYRPEAGQINLGGVEVAGEPQHRIARLGLARTFQTTQLFGQMSVLENIVIVIAMRRGGLGWPFRPVGTGFAADAAGLLRYVGYQGSLEVEADELPHVDRRLVEIARALALRPAVLTLDEPAAGLSPADTRRLGLLLRRIAAAGVTVLVVEHDMDLVMSASDRIVVMDAGAAIAEGSPTAIAADPRVRQAYLGVGGIVGLGRQAPWAGQRDAGLNVVALSAGYGAAAVIKELTFAVHTGEMVALLGANGAGKTTLMAVLSGLLQPTGGAVEFLGVSLTGRKAAEIAGSGLILVPEGRQVFPELSVMDNLRLGGFTRRGHGLQRDIAVQFARFPRLKERAEQRAGLLSGGEQQMLAIARGLMARPKLLLLDEPSLGLAPKLIEQLYSDLAALRDGGLTMILVDQMAAMALSVVDRALVLENGQVMRQGAAADLAADPDLILSYLGTAQGGSTDAAA